MSRHVRATVAVAVLSLVVFGSPVQAQFKPSAQELADVPEDNQEAVRRRLVEEVRKYQHNKLLEEGANARRRQDEHGDAPAQINSTAYLWYLAAAEQGDAQAQFLLGRMYATGEGWPQDEQEAVTWYRLAAEQGYTEAQFNLGSAYANGRGVTKDDREAAAWWHLAAEQGDALAQRNLGLLYDLGRGVPQDDREAASWLRLAAEQGDAQSQYLLGFMYDYGEGVPQDYAEAHIWLNLAASRSTGEQREQAVTARDRVAKKMAPADLREAQRRAREWHAAHPVP